MFFVFVYFFVCVYFVLFVFFCLLFMRRLPHCVIQFKSVSKDLRIYWIPSSLVNFLDMINIMYFLSRVLGFHLKIAFVFIRIPSVSFYTDTIRFLFLYGHHLFLFIWTPSISFHSDTIRFFSKSIQHEIFWTTVKTLGTLWLSSHWVYVFL